MVLWARPVHARDQLLLFYPTVEDIISEDHPVRLFDDLLRSQDWRPWETMYDQHLGQPPIHPRILAGAIVYGIHARLKSSRQLEDACINRLDFIWLMDGRRVDHSTFAKFRNRHEKGLTQLFVGVCKTAQKMGHIDLITVATDGTRIQANSSRHGTASKEELEKWIAGLDQSIKDTVEEMKRTDEAEDQVYGSGSPSQLPLLLQNKKKRKELLEKAHQEVIKIEARREAKHEESPEKTAKVPVSDSDARVLPNKEGGFAPNYTPVITTDGKNGFIVDAEVTNSTAEAPIQRDAADRIEQMLGHHPEEMLGDGLYTDLATIIDLENKGISVLVPAPGVGAMEGDVAYRKDPREAVPEEAWSKLPVSKEGKRLVRAAFQFEAEEDCYYCPRSKRLTFRCVTNHQRSNGQTHQTRVYRTHPTDCVDCPLWKRCIPERQKDRRVERPEGSDAWLRIVHKMCQPGFKERYERRKVIAETPFAHIKQNLGIRRFLHRGLKKVRQEWKWICTSYNVAKLVRLMGRDRKNPWHPGAGLGELCAE